MFKPIAIVGQSCLLPQASTPMQLWQNVVAKKNCLTAAAKAMVPASLSSPDIELIENKILHGGYVNTKPVLNSNDFAINLKDLAHLDRIFHWLLYTGSEAIKNAQLNINKISAIKAGMIIGNLGYATKTLNQYAENIWLAENSKLFTPAELKQIKSARPDPRNRFMSGFPVQFCAKALNLSNAYAIDAACSSSLYAIKLACDQLQRRQADVMLAGGVNAADNLFIHAGFSNLNALSPSGQSLPFQKTANGLVPAEGAGMIVLKRLTDAVKNSDKVYGVIRSIGLSNDGRSGGFLAPAKAGQVAAMQQAYQQANIEPDSIDLVDCHATGTPVGDGIEISSMQEIFKNKTQTPTLCALKSNLGHSLTTSGIAALLRSLWAIQEKTLPATLTTEEPIDALKNSDFKLLNENKPWQTNKPKRAAISCFGFGGNNAHLIVEEYQPKTKYKNTQTSAKKAEDIVIVSIGVIAASCSNVNEFQQALLTQTACLNKQGNLLGGFSKPVDLLAEELNFPPKDLEKALPQQIYFLKACQQAIAKTQVDENTAVYAGMQPSTVVSRYGFRWRLAELIGQYSKAPKQNWLQQAKSTICPPLTGANVIGNMPNIVANRVNLQFNLKGPSFSVSRGELSGTQSLLLAKHALQNHEISAALVGAVDMSCETVQAKAAAALCKTNHRTPGDAAVVLVLKRLSDAEKNNDKIIAHLSETTLSNTNFTLGDADQALNICQLFGHAHAACGLLHTAAAAVLCQTKINSSAKIILQAFNGDSQAIYLHSGYKNDN
ncbi:MAG: hypothetical protein K0U12_05625 [Gammaproteobacteria bacterium]|nr:hypothetical protein [Gammaproteobacteria bacterium]